MGGGEGYRIFSSPSPSASLQGKGVYGRVIIPSIAQYIYLRHTIWKAEIWAPLMMPPTII
jgi:hypothetical protein